MYFSQNWRKFGKKKNAVVNSSRTGNKSKKGTGELRSLVSSINYDRKADTNSKGSLKSIVGLRSVSMNLKILSWNVRGLNNFHKRVIVKILLKEWKGDVIFLQ